MPSDLAFKRNICIFLLCLQLIGSIFGFFVFFDRGQYLFAGTNIISVAVILVGLVGALRMQKFKIGFHGAATTGIFSVIYIYFLLEGLFNGNLQKVHHFLIFLMKIGQK